MGKLRCWLLGHHFLRQHLSTGWTLVCHVCQLEVLLNPRERDAPVPIGVWDEGKLQEGRKRADVLALARRKIAARRSMP